MTPPRLQIEKSVFCESGQDRGIRRVDGCQGHAPSGKRRSSRSEGEVGSSCLDPESLSVLLLRVLRSSPPGSASRRRASRHRQPRPRPGGLRLRKPGSVAPPVTDSPSLVSALGPALRGEETRAGLPLSLLLRAPLLRAPLSAAGRPARAGPGSGVRAVRSAVGVDHPEKPTTRDRGLSSSWKRV